MVRMQRWVQMGVLIVLLAISGDRGLIAQEATPEPEPTLTSGHTNAVLYDGPGDTFFQLGVLNAGVDVTISERNAIGNWVHVSRENSRGQTIIDGWVLTGYLNISRDLRFSDVPVTRLPDADTSTVRFAPLVDLYAAPVISRISPQMQIIHQRGLALGNLPNVVTKVGDSLTADPLYLNILTQDGHRMGPYDYLEDTVDYFREDMYFESLAAKIGMTTYGVLDPMWSDAEMCQPNETPLDCEIRVRQPSIAMIMFGPNDVKHMTAEEYAEQMHMIVEETLAQGVIPVVSTFSYDPNAELWWQSVDFNLAVVAVANEYQIPLINLWAAARPLPYYGLEGDGIHMLHSGFRFLNFATGNEAFYGASLRNLLTVRMLYEIKQTLGLDA